MENLLMEATANPLMEDTMEATPTTTTTLTTPTILTMHTTPTLLTPMLPVPMPITRMLTMVRLEQSQESTALQEQQQGQLERLE